MPILLETAYLPPISYMAEVLRAGAVVIEVNETYQKQTYRNHCSIYGPNGKQILSIPVVKVNGNHTTIKNIRISDQQPWQKIHWRSIETAYNNSPFFLFYQDMFALLYEKKFGFLVDWNLELLKVILKIIKVDVKIDLTISYEKYPVIESVQSVGLNLKNNPDQEKTAEMKDLRGKLVQKNTDLQMEYPHYTQVFEPRHGFIPGLSVIDAIFNLGPETGDYLDQIMQGVP